jgi:hypothetical protein
MHFNMKMKYNFPSLSSSSCCSQKIQYIHHITVPLSYSYSALVNIQCLIRYSLFPFLHAKNHKRDGSRSGVADEIVLSHSSFIPPSGASSIGN